MLLPLSHSHSRFKSRSHIHTRRISNFVQKLAPSKEESTGKHAHHDAQTHTRARTLQNRQGDEIVARQRESRKFASHKFVSNSEHKRKRTEHAHTHRRRPQTPPHTYTHASHVYRRYVQIAQKSHIRPTTSIKSQPRPAKIPKLLRFFSTGTSKMCDRPSLVGS